MAKNTMEVGKRLVELCDQGKNDQAMQELYAEDITSVEAGAPPGESAETKGVAACRKKGEQFMSEHEFHSAKHEGPFPHGDRFAVYLEYDLTQKASKQRFKMKEVGLYTVKDGKITREEFFYAM